MGYYQEIENCVEDILLGLHTAFVGKVVQMDGVTATVQPLHLIKQIGEPEERQGVIADVPILQSVKKFDYEECGICKKQHLVMKPIEKDDIVFCLCGERDITDAKEGKFNLPTEHHSIKDAVIIGVF